MYIAFKRTRPCKYAPVVQTTSCLSSYALSDVFATKTTMKTKAVFSSLTPALHDVHAAINAMVSLMVAIRENHYGNVNFIPF